MNSSTSVKSNFQRRPSDELLELLEHIQLEKFWQPLRDQLQITRLSHFEYVEDKDLEKIGMSKPAIRRLLDAVNKKTQHQLNISVQSDDSFINKNYNIHFQHQQAHRSSLRPVRPAPPPPLPAQLPSSFSPNSILKISATYNNKTTNNTIPFNPDNRIESKLYTNNITKNVMTSKLLNLNKNKKSLLAAKDSASSSSSSSASNGGTNQKQQVSFLINPNDIQIARNNKNEEVVLGSGNFGFVKKAVWKHPDSNTKINVAVKCLHNKSSNSSDQEKQSSFIDLVNEITCMCGLNHKNLIKLYGIVLNSNASNNIVMMVTELAPHGSLLYFMRDIKENKKKYLAMPLLYSFIFQIACGMEYLESKNLIHRDLAARNILLFTREQIKICDFGMTRSVENGFYTMKETHKIPAAWYPPESIREKLFSIKSDVWMYGVTIWEIFTYCDQPWPNMSSNEILQKICNENQRLPLPYLCSKDFYSIVLVCWSKNQSDRPSFEILRKLIKETKIVEMKAKTEFKQDNKLEIELGDLITIIEGNAEKYWWKGQNNRTMMVGHFPRAILNPQRHLTGEDISLPLKNSFIHTGHMSAGPSEKTWGNPGKIDEIFLANPLNPPDLISDLTENNFEFTKTETSIEIIDKPFTNNNKSSNLIDLLDITINYPNDDNKVRVTYPDYSASLDSFESPSSTQSSQSSSTLPKANANHNFPISSAAFINCSPTDQNSNMPIYMNENQNLISSQNQYLNSLNTNVQLENENYYNINMNYKKVLHENAFPVYKSNSPVFNYNASSAQNPVNPFFDSSVPTKSYNSITTKSETSFKSNGGERKQLVQSMQEENNKKLKVDDLLDQMISMNINLL